MRAPSPNPFLGARVGNPDRAADALILGLAADGGVSFRAGASEGPSGIRRFSVSIETWSPGQSRDLEALRVVDVGDFVGHATGVERAAGTVLQAAWGETRKPLLCSIGGDHSVTPPLVRAVAARARRLALVGFDAHLDLRESYEGDHACTYRRIAERGVPCVVLGVRSGARSEWTDAPHVLAHCSSELTIPQAVRDQLEGRDVYVTIDIDVLDPAAAPGTGNPEPGGPMSGALLEALSALEGLRVVAFDVVEVAPPLDPSGITQVTAAVIVREMLLRFATRL